MTNRSWMAVAVLLTSCSAAGTTISTEGLGLTFSKQEPTLLEGKFVDSGGEISFTAVETEPMEATITFMFNGKTLRFDIDYNIGGGYFESNGNMMTAAEQGRMLALAETVAQVMPFTPEERTKVQHVLTTQSAYLAVAPVDEALPSFEIINERGWTCISGTCSTQYIGAGYYRQAGKGWSCTGGSGNGCKGHCGVGCNSDLHGNYTQDCARHDYGLLSWANASDDYCCSNCWR